MAEQVNQRRDKDKHSRKGSSRPKARALSGIKSPCARVKQPFTKAVAINPGNPTGKKGLDPPHACCGASPYPCSPSVPRCQQHQLPPPQDPGGDKSQLYPCAGTSASSAPTGAGGNPGSGTPCRRTRRPHQLLDMAATSTPAHPAACVPEGSEVGVGSIQHAGPAGSHAEGTSIPFRHTPATGTNRARGCGTQHHLQPPPRHSLAFLSPPAFSWQIVR